MRDLIKIAAAEIGQKELPGEAHNPRIVEYAQESGITWIDDDETPWCSTFMNWIAFEGEVERTDRANARSWLTVGRKADPPEPGDVVIFWRESVDSHKGHVGLFLGFSSGGDRVYVLGGNQGNQVGVSAYGSDRILGFRRLRSSGGGIPGPVLQRGDQGEEVVKLQDALKLVHLEPGTSDGIFGPRTETAVRALQSTSDPVGITGIYDEGTRDALERALQDLG
ncbi:MAG TPA: TIGR02594 family protein [Longimicrobiales bacterium]|nr:TIGR02594 family protein [Longimicrobiales bacterium]